MLGILIAVISIISWMLWTYSYYQVSLGFASIRSGWGGEKVYFKGSFLAYPIVHKVEEIDISEKRVLLNLSNEHSVYCKDNIRVNLQLTFFVQIPSSKYEILKIAQYLGCQRATQKDTLDNLFTAKFSEAIKSAAKQLDYLDLLAQQKAFKRRLMQELSEGLNGFQLNRISIAVLEYTPLDLYDLDHHILDAVGYKKIKSLLDQQKNKF